MLVRAHHDRTLTRDGMSEGGAPPSARGGSLPSMLLPDPERQAAPIRMHGVHVRETNPPAGPQPLAWVLLTRMELHTGQEPRLGCWIITSSEGAWKTSSVY